LHLNFMIGKRIQFFDINSNGISIGFKLN
jgi:hypothetical protein